MKVVYVNIKNKYLFIKEYENAGELLRIIRRIYHSPHTPILPLLIEGLNNGSYDVILYTIKYYFDNLGYKIIPNLKEYSSYPLYKSKNSK